MIAYLDSSVVLRKIFCEENQVMGLERFDAFVSSALLKTECLCVLSRVRRSKDSSEEEIALIQSSLFYLIKSITLIGISTDVLDRAGEDFPVYLKTLDAIHLATFLLYAKEASAPLTLITHDQALGQAALALGFSVLGILPSKIGV